MLLYWMCLDELATRRLGSKGVTGSRGGRFRRTPLDASRSSLSRRERRLVEENSVVVDLPVDGELAATHSHDDRQFFLLERGRAHVSVDGTTVGVLDPGDVIAPFSGVRLRAATRLRLRVLNAQEFAVVRTIPALRDRLVVPLPAAAH